MEAYDGSPQRSAGGHSGAVELRRLLTVEALAELLNVKERHVRRLVAERRVPVVKWGHLVRFDPAEITAWLNEHRRGAEEA